MKPIKLSFAAFGPYADEQVIEFDSLCKSGLFLIHGETGSGKTVILDALTYALYGESSGGARGGLVSMRCQFADKTTETYTELVFRAHSKIYTFSRRLKAVHKRSGGIDYIPVQNVLVQNEDGKNEPVFENPKASLVREEAQKIIGLDYEQFRQIIILPQGQFEKLLASDSGAKEQILSTLFNAQKWDKVSEYLTEKARAEKHGVTELESQISHIYEENSCENAEDMKELFERLSADASELEMEKEFAAAEHKALSEEYDREKTLFDSYERYSALKNRLNELAGHGEEINNMSSLLHNAENAQKAKPVYDMFVSAKKSADKRLNDLSVSKDCAEKAQSAFASAQSAFEQINSRSEEISELETKRVRLEAMRGIYENLTVLSKKTELVGNAVKRAEKRLKKLEKEQTELLAERSQLEEKQACLYEEYIIMFRSSDVAAQLASELDDGAPCPVCGSCTHPKKAQPCGVVSTDALAQKQDEIDKATDALKTLKQALVPLGGRLDDARTQYRDVSDEYAHCRAEYNTLLESADSDFKSEKELDDEINRITGETDRLKDELENAKTAMDDARTELSASQVRLASSQTEYENAKRLCKSEENRFAEELNRRGFDSVSEFEEYMLDDERINELREHLEQYRTELSAVQKSIAALNEVPKERPDIDASLKKRDDAYEKYEQTSNALAVASDEVKRCEKQIKRLNSLEKKYKKQYERCAEIASFAEAVAGSKGISLKRYVLGVMLSAVTAEANRMLKNVHGGRYRLYRRADTNSKSKKLGLSLEVFDSYSDKRRDVSTLSGGEKFLVSLALSIGLSSTVQQQSAGIRTDAMFIDEGFGTLDSGSITDALDILSGLRRADCVIGIISHIPALRENIHSCIEVKKDRLGSRIVIKE